MNQTMVATPAVDAVRVALLIGNEILGRGLEAVLMALPTVQAVHRCRTPQDTQGLLDSQQLDFLIVAAPDLAALAVLPRPLGEKGTRLLVLVDETADVDPFGYTTWPVDGFLSQRDLDAASLSAALQRCGLGELPMPAALARALIARAEAPPQSPRGRTANLTAREVEALSLLVRGMSNKQIARRLAISSHGAKRLVANIMLKLDSPNRTTAVVNALRAGIIDYQ